jgi:8-amino-7-oxononanoate synthase
LDEALASLASRDLRRTRARRRDRDDEGVLALTSNDYLGYGGAAVDYTDTDSWPTQTGAGAARLIYGSTKEHDALEDALAAYLGVDDALVFSSGYAANVGLLSCLAGPDDLVVSDQLNHASIIDGCRLARARIAVVPHLDVDAVDRALAEHAARADDGRQRGRAFVVTESYFSMDGDVPDLAALRAITHRHGAALLVDEAHAIGLFGPRGRGLCAAAGIVPDARVGTFGKAIGASGAFVAGSTSLIAWLWNRARSFVFSTGISPLLAHAALAGLRRVEADEAGRTRVLAYAERLRRGLRELGYDVPAGSMGPIIPVLLGEASRALAVTARLAEDRVRVIPIRPPTVPEGSSRLRVTVHAGLAEADIDRALAAFARAAR